MAAGSLLRSHSIKQPPSQTLHPLIAIINEAEKCDVGSIHFSGYACEAVEALVLRRVEDPARKKKIKPLCFVGRRSHNKHVKTPAKCK
jgi:hypothetical protein